MSLRLLVPATVLLAAAIPALPARAGVVQVDVGALFDSDVVVNNGTGVLDPTQDPIDLGNAGNDNFCFPTQSAALELAVAPQTPDGLPDDAFFPATGRHPDVQLWWDNADDGLNARRIRASTGGFAIDVPAGSYLEVHLFATSGDTASDIEVVLSYADGLSAPTAVVVPDWFDDPVPTDDLYPLVDGLDRVQPGSGPGTPYAYEDPNDTAIFGMRFVADPTRTLLQVLVDRTDTTGVFDFFGLTAVTAAPEACCLTDGTCLDTLAADCVAQGGTPQGADTDCGSTTCTPDLPGWTPDGATRPGQPLTVTKAAGAGDLLLEWSTGCSPYATDYTVHEGAIGAWYFHQAVICDTLGARTVASFGPARGDRYFLVAPITATSEGSFGLDSLGAERPSSSAPSCRPAQVLGCP